MASQINALAWDDSDDTADVGETALGPGCEFGELPGDALAVPDAWDCAPIDGARPAEEWLSARAAADYVSLTTRQLRNLTEEGMPVLRVPDPAGGRPRTWYPLPLFADWIEIRRWQRHRALATRQEVPARLAPGLAWRLSVARRALAIARAAELDEREPNRSWRPDRSYYRELPRVWPRLLPLVRLIEAADLGRHFERFGHLDRFTDHTLAELVVTKYAPDLGVSPARPRRKSA
jgi:hypothetical protein